MDAYQQYIHKSRYARYIPELKRRETWEETVGRYVDYWGDKLPEKDAKEARKAIENLEVMPSMRALMTAGEALDRDNVAGFNCSYMPIDHPKAFDELMYVLMSVSTFTSCQRWQRTSMEPTVLYTFQTQRLDGPRRTGNSSLCSIVVKFQSGTYLEYDLRVHPSKHSEVELLGQSLLRICSGSPLRSFAPLLDVGSVLSNATIYAVRLHRLSSWAGSEEVPLSVSVTLQTTESDEPSQDSGG